MTVKALKKSTIVAVIGAGAMGAGIAQVAADAKHHVLLFDVGQGAAERGKQRIEAGLHRLVKRGKRTPAEVDETLGRISIVRTIGVDSGWGLESYHKLLITNLATYIPL